MNDSDDTRRLRHGERLHATVLFTDMKGFTAFSHDADPEEVDRLMTSVFGEFTRIVDRYGGSVEKYIGDAMVAVFGVPRVHEDDAVRAVAAAWEFRELVASDYQHLTFRTGIHSGLITTGKRGEHDVVTGHALAVASRLETTAEPGEILVSEEVYEVAREAFSFGEPREVRVRGREEVAIARIVEDRRGRAAQIEQPFVGREELLQELTRRYLQSTGGSAASVVLSAAPGMGAGEIARRFAAEIGAFPRFDGAVIIARPTPYSASPYSAMRYAIRRLLDLDDVSSEGEIRDAVAQTLVPAESQDAVVEFLCNGASEVNPGGLYPMVGEVLRHLTRSDTALFPGVFIIDDLDELSPEERHLLRFVVGSTESKRFYVATSRDLRNQTVDILPNASVLEVPPLTESETAQLIMELKGGTPDEEFVAEMHARTGGNPTFVRELLRYLEEHPGATELPVRIQTVILAGIQTLPEECRDALRRLSVMDHPFRPQDAERVCGDVATDDVLDRLLEQRCLRREGNRFVFADELTRQSVYDSLLHHNKRVLHAAAVESIADDDLPPVVRVRHLVRTGEERQAALTLQELRGRMANFDRRILEPIDAILAGSAVSDPNLVGELLYLRLAILFNTNAPNHETDSSIRRLLRIGLETRSSDLMGKAYAFLLGWHSRNGALAAARRAGYEALRHYERSGAEARTDSVRTFLAIACIRQGHTDEADRLLAALANPSQRYGAMGERALQRYDYPAAYDHTLQSLEATRGDPPQIAAFARAVEYCRLVRILIACRSWRTILAIQPEIGGVTGPWYGYHSAVYSGLAMAAHHLGMPDEAVAHLERAAYYSRQARDHLFWYYGPVSLAMARVEMGQIDAALAELRQLFMDLAVEPYEDALLTTLELTLRALEGRDEEGGRFYLAELDSLITSAAMSGDYDRMVAAWYRYRLGSDDGMGQGDRDSLREAHSLAVTILQCQSDDRFTADMRAGYPYRDILAEWDRAGRPSRD